MKLIVGAFVVVAITGCETVNAVRALDPRVARSQVAAAAQTQMVGMSREQVLACMGPPMSQASEGRTEVWRYLSSDNRIIGRAGGFADEASGLGTSFSTTQRSCIVNVAMTNGQVSRIFYQGNTGGFLTADEQCGYAVAQCVQ